MVLVFLSVYIPFQTLITEFRMQGTSSEFSATFALAGGEILGGKAYMVDYHSDIVHLSLSPPWTILAGSKGPFVAEKIDRKERIILLDVSNIFHRIVIEAKGSKVSDISSIPLFQ